MVSPAGLKLIEDFEGYWPDWYLDSVGVRTIGFGHTDEALPKGISIPLSRDEAVALLRADLRGYEAAVDRLVKVPLTQPQRDALVSFTFNLGAGALGGSTLLRKLNARDYAGAQEEFGKWVHGGGKVLPGLVRRRKAEADLFGSSTQLPLTKVQVRRFQAAHNKFRSRWRLPYKILAVDGVLGPQTKAAIKEDKYLLGYLGKYQVWSEISESFLKRLAHPSFGFNAAQIARGIARRRAFRKLDLSTVAGCAQFLLKSPNVSFWDGLSTGSDRKNVERLAKGLPAFVPATGRFVFPKHSLMRALVDMARHGHIMLNALTGGHHSVNSNHYRGAAVDLDLSVGSASEIERIANRYGGRRNFETDHIHLDF